MALIKEIDYGTPIRLSEKTVTLSIDGQRVTVQGGTPPTRSNPSAPAGSASSRSRADAARPPPAPHRPKRAWLSAPNRRTSPGCARA